MKGLRNFLMLEGHSRIKNLKYFSKETSYKMVVLDFIKSKNISNNILVNDKKVSIYLIKSTPNYSWKISPKYKKYFTGKLVGEFLTCSGGMTIGKNKLFIRNIDDNGFIKEEYNFSYFNDPITLKKRII